MENLAYLAGVVMSLVFSYVPGLKVKFEALSGDYKRLVLLLTLFVAASGLYLYQSGLVWDQAYALETLKAFVQAAIASQAAYVLTPETK